MQILPCVAAGKALILLLFATLGALASGPASVPPLPPVSVAVRCEVPCNSFLLKEMRQELEAVFAKAGIVLDWQNASGEPHTGRKPNTIVVTLGAAPIGATGPASRAPDIPLGYTLVSRGEIQPVCGVDLDAIRETIEPVVPTTLDPPFSVTVGRAAARVAAHEIYHVLTRSPEHGRKGVAAPLLTARDLVYAELRFDRADAGAMRAGLEKSRRRHGAQPDFEFVVEQDRQPAQSEKSAKGQ